MINVVSPDNPELFFALYTAPSSTLWKGLIMKPTSGAASMVKSLFSRSTAFGGEVLVFR